MWISGLFDVAMTAGVLCVLLATLSHSGSGAAAALPLALLSKETGVIAGPIGVLWAFVRQDGRRVALFTLVTCLVFLVGRVVVFPPPAEFGLAPAYLVKEMIPVDRRHPLPVASSTRRWSPCSGPPVVFAVFRTRYVPLSVTTALDTVLVLSILCRCCRSTDTLRDIRVGEQPAFYLGVAFARGGWRMPWVRERRYVGWGGCHGPAAFSDVRPAGPSVGLAGSRRPLTRAARRVELATRSRFGHRDQRPGSKRRVRGKRFRRSTWAAMGSQPSTGMDCVFRWKQPCPGRPSVTRRRRPGLAWSVLFTTDGAAFAEAEPGGPHRRGDRGVGQTRRR